MNYQAYPNKKTMVSRKSRKSSRAKVFVGNKKMRAVFLKTRRAERIA